MLNKVYRVLLILLFAGALLLDGFLPYVAYLNNMAKPIVKRLGEAHFEVCNLVEKYGKANTIVLAKGGLISLEEEFSSIDKNLSLYCFLINVVGFPISASILFISYIEDSPRAQEVLRTLSIALLIALGLFIPVSGVFTSVVRTGNSLLEKFHTCPKVGNVTIWNITNIDRAFDGYVFKYLKDNVIILELRYHLTDRDTTKLITLALDYGEINSCLTPLLNNTLLIIYHVNKTCITYALERTAYKVFQSS